MSNLEKLKEIENYVNENLKEIKNNQEKQKKEIEFRKQEYLENWLRELNELFEYSDTLRTDIPSPHIPEGSFYYGFHRTKYEFFIVYLPKDYDSWVNRECFEGIKYFSLNPHNCSYDEVKSTLRSCGEKMERILTNWEEEKPKLEKNLEETIVARMNLRIHTAEANQESVDRKYNEFCN